MIALSLLAGGAFASTPVTFETPRTFSTGRSCVTVVSGDFDRDGKPDLITANADSGSLSLLLGNGDGSFQGQRAVEMSPYPFSVAAGDFNRDGRLDVAVTTLSWGQDLWFHGLSLSLLLGNGDGSFQPPTPVAQGAYLVSAGDLNRDGKLDLLYTSEAGTVSVLLGDGAGGFQPAPVTSLSTSVSVLRSIDLPPTVADLNVDGKPDVVLMASNPSGQDTQAVLLLGKGDGTFDTPRLFPIAGFAEGTAVADFNQDAWPDLALTTYDQYVAVLKGRPNGHLSGKRTFQVGATATAIAVADLNGDGRPDLAVANFDEDTVSVLAGSGKGKFDPRQDFQAGDGAFTMAIDDFNRDGRPDIAIPDQRGGTISVLLNSTVF